MPLSKLPPELGQYVVAQNYDLYTPMDHASWRYILRVSRVYLGQHAHPLYLEGLQKTGIDLEQIPRISEMDRCLQKFGWRAVAVSGFIPPAIFLELQALGVLPIACDMRTIEHIHYTPAPDIVHEAAGHAPLLVDPEYAAYLQKYAEIARKAIYTREDMRVFEEIRDLSIIKEDPSSTQADIEAQQAKLDEAIKSNMYLSEATLLGRMAWWSTEYGLIENEQKHFIFGAGLLSSVGESYNALNPEVRKVPYTLDCIHQTFDITRPQPTLFVAQNFVQMTRVLEEFSEQMAYRRGGQSGLAKALQARTVTTTTLDSGLQISGELSEVSFDGELNPIFVKFIGPCQLSYQDRELEGHGRQTHSMGFSSPLGKIAGRCASELSAKDFQQFGFQSHQKGHLRFASGSELEGIYLESVQGAHGALVHSFDQCTIRHKDQTLYRPEWGRFDLACGSKVLAVFGGPADRVQFSGKQNLQTLNFQPKTNLTAENRALNELYARVRLLRQQGISPTHLPELQSIYERAKKLSPQDWLLTLELLELAAPVAQSWAQSLRHDLLKRPDPHHLIARGLEAVDLLPLSKVNSAS